MSDILQCFQKRSPKQMEIELNKSIKERIFHAVIFEVAVRCRVMNKLLILSLALCLSGCVDLGKIGTHPEVASFYINHPKSQVADCLIYASSREHLSLEFDDNLPDGSERYNLQDSDPTDVAWVEVSKFSGKQTTVEFYYAPHDPELHKSILSIVDQCNK